MARVLIRVECDGGSDTEIVECSLMPVHGGQQAALLVQEAFLRTCRALGVVEAPPEPPEPQPPAEAAVTDITTKGKP